MPALCFTSLARAADPASLAAWAPLLWNMGSAIGAGWAVGWATATLVAPPPALRGHVIAAAGFGNVANLLLVLAGGLCRGPAARAALLPAGSPAAASPRACEALGAAYVMTPVLVATLAQLLAVEALLRLPGGEGGGGGGFSGPAAAVGPASPASVVAELVPLAADGMERGGGGGGMGDAGEGWTLTTTGAATTTNSADIATFSVTASATRLVTVDTNRNIGGITFSSNSATDTNGYTLSANTAAGKGAILKLSNGGVIPG